MTGTGTGALRRWAADPLGQDAAVALALTVLGQAQLGAGVAWSARLLVLVVTAAVAWRRSRPLLVCAVVSGGVALMQVTPDQPSVLGEYLAVILASFTVAERTSLGPALAGLAAVVAGIVGHDVGTADYGSASAMAGDLVVPVLLWGVGRVAREQRRRADRSDARAGRLEQDRAEVARLAVAAEREHLARELHDVVTHSVSVVVIQAQGLRRVLDDAEPEVRDALGAIESAGRAALDEMRRLLELLPDQAPGERRPLPGVDEVAELVRRTSSGQLPVRLDVSGSLAAVPAGVGLTAYRVVQEALSNAVRHSHASGVRVRLVAAPTALDIEVVDDGAGGPALLPGSGRGLAGMRERVSAYGGELSAGPGPHGGFAVRCHLPLASRDPGLSRPVREDAR